jgi:hypothetical protein
MIKMLYNICTGIYKFGNNTYPRCIRHRSNLGHVFAKKVCLMGWKIWYVYIYHLKVGAENDLLPGMLDTL